MEYLNVMRELLKYNIYISVISAIQVCDRWSELPIVSYHDAEWDSDKVRIDDLNGISFDNMNGVTEEYAPGYDGIYITRVANGYEVIQVVA